MRTKTIGFMAALIVAALGLVGCSTTHTLRMQAVSLVRDNSSASAKLAARKYSKIMVIPPTSRDPGQFDTQINFFEREFLKHDITVITAAITGRLSATQTEESKTKGGTQLSEAERVLIMARETGANAYLQIGQFSWDDDTPTTRYFILDPGSTDYREVKSDEYQSWTKKKRAYTSPWLTFVGKLVDVETGEVMASFHIESGANFDLQTDYVVKIIESKGAMGGWTVEAKENFPYGRAEYDEKEGGITYAGGSWVGSAKQRVIQKVIALAAKRIVGQ